MWLDLRELFSEIDDYLLTVGRSLLICQNYESNCKYVMKMVELAKAFQSEKITIIGSIEHDDFVEQLSRIPLGQSIEILAQPLKITKRYITILKEAKNSRNYIAHEVAIRGFYKRRSEDILSDYVPVLYRHVKNVAEGDNIVSGWSYEISEKEPAPKSFQSSYVKGILDWVFSGYPPEILT